MVGNEHLATARIVTFVAVIPMILIVNVLNDFLSRHSVVAVINLLFALGFAAVNVLLRTDTYGIGDPTTPRSPWRWVGWVNYVLIESYGSISIAAFWAMVNVSTTSSTTAKRCYPLLVISGQIAGVSGPFISRWAPVLGLINLQMFGNIGVFCVIVLIIVYALVFERKSFYLCSSNSVVDAVTTAVEPHDQASADATASLVHADGAPVSDIEAAQATQSPDPASMIAVSATTVTILGACKNSCYDAMKSVPILVVLLGILATFVLLLTNPYLLGIAGVSTIYEVVGTIMDQQMKQQAAVYFHQDTVCNFVLLFSSSCCYGCWLWLLLLLLLVVVAPPLCIMNHILILAASRRV
jgi:hypothetical protein